jgi:acyl-CoA thioester hydrolase
VRHDPIEYRLRIQLRWRDMDMLGHLNQAVYHELLEDGRVGLMSEVMRRAGGKGTHGAWVLAHVALDHHQEVRKDHGEVEVVVRLSRLGSSSVTLEHEIRRPDDVLAASGRTVLVAWDPARRSKRQPTDAERAAFGASAGE